MKKEEEMKGEKRGGGRRPARERRTAHRNGTGGAGNRDAEAPGGACANDSTVGDSIANDSAAGDSANAGTGGGESQPRHAMGAFEKAVRRALRATGAWFSRLWAKIAIAWRPLGTKLRRFVSPVFLGMLILSFFLWYLIKLGYTYTAELPVNVKIGGREIKATVVAEGVGYRLMSYRFSSRKNISIDWSDVETSLSASNPQAVVISPYSLQNIISMRNPDIRVISMGAIPEIEL